MKVFNLREHEAEYKSFTNRINKEWKGVWDNMSKQATPLQNKPVGTIPPTDEPSQQDVKMADSLFRPVNPEEEASEVGVITSEKVEFLKVGDRLLGLYMGKQRFNIEDEPWLYEVENSAGEWSFWGCTILDARMKEVPEGMIVDIIYLGERKPKGRGRPYKDYKVRFFYAPQGFDRIKHAVHLDTNTRLAVWKTIERDDKGLIIPF